MRAARFTEAIRRRVVWVAGATRWRNPEEDLPTDFEANRDVHYAAVRQPLDPSAFMADLKDRVGAALTRLDEGIAAETTGGVKITTRRGDPWIGVIWATVPKWPTNHPLNSFLWSAHCMILLVIAGLAVEDSTGTALYIFMPPSPRNQ